LQNTYRKLPLDFKTNARGSWGNHQSRFAFPVKVEKDPDQRTKSFMECGEGESSSDKNLEYEGCILELRQKQDWNGMLHIWNTVKREARCGGNLPSIRLVELVLVALNGSKNQFAQEQAQRVADEYLRLTEPKKSCRSKQKSKDKYKSSGSLVYFSAAINACKVKKMWKHALWLLGEMERRGIQPNLFCYNAAIGVCSSVGELQSAEYLVGKMSRCGIDPDVYTFTMLLKGCVCGRLGHGPYQGSVKGPQWKSALRYLKEMSNRGIEPNAYSYTAAINVFAEARKLHKVDELFQEMKQAHIAPTTITFNSMIKAYGNLGKWKQVLAYLKDMEEIGVKPNVNSYNSAINACAKAGQFRHAVDIFKAMERDQIPMDEITFNSMVKACNSVKAWRKALAYLDKMKAKKITPSLHTYNSVIHACVQAKEYERAETLFQEMKMPPDVVTITTLLHSCCTLDRYSKAFYFLSIIEAERIEVDAQVFGAALNALVTAKAPTEDILEVFHRMQQTGLSPNAVTFSSLVKAFSSQGATQDAAFEYLDQMTEAPIPATVEAYNICIDACSAVEADISAEVLFKRMEQKGIDPDVITYNSLIKIHSLKGNSSRSMELLSRMRAFGVEPSTNSYNGVFKACLKSGNLYQIWNLYEEMSSNNIEPNGTTFDILLRAASQQGNHKKACQFLDLMTSTTKRPSLSNYHAVIYACGSTFDSNPALAFSILQQIRRSGLTPTTNSYNGVLAACVNKQDLTVAIKTLYEMQRQDVPITLKSRRLAMEIITPTLLQVSKGDRSLKKKMNDYIDDILNQLKLCAGSQQQPDHCLNSIIFTILFDPIEEELLKKDLRPVSNGHPGKDDGSDDNSLSLSAERLTEEKIVMQ